MKNKISSVAGLISGIAASMLPLISLAQVGRVGPRPTDPPGGTVQFETVSGALCTLVAWIFTLLVVLTVIFILWAAYLYLTSAGEEEKIKKANHQLLYAAIALVVSIL